MSEKILIIGPAWVGDMVMAQTLFKVLRQLHPDAIIDVVAPPHTAVLTARMPEIRQHFPIAIQHGKLGLKVRYQLAKTLRAQHYTQAIVLQNSWKSALLPFFARIPKRTGWVGEQRYILLNDIRKLDKIALPLMIQRFAALAFPTNTNLKAFADEFDFNSLPWPALMVTEAQKTAALEKVQANPHQAILALCPGAEFGAAKRWPAEHYATLAQEYLKRGWAVWLFGSPKEQEAAEIIMQATQDQCLNFVGKTKLLEAIDLLSTVTAVVTNDSGLMHIAAAAGKPIVVMYGSSSAKFTPPLSAQAQMLSLNLNCSPCFQRECPLGHMKCLRDLMPEQVMAAVDALLEN